MTAAKRILLEELEEQAHPEPVENVIFWALEHYANSEPKDTWGRAIAYAVKQRILDAESQPTQETAMTKEQELYPVLQDWANATNPSDMLFALQKINFTSSEFNYRIVACDFIRETPFCGKCTTWDLLSKEEFRNAVEIAERYSQGDSTRNELKAACKQARAAGMEHPIHPDNAAIMVTMRGTEGASFAGIAYLVQDILSRVAEFGEADSLIAESKSRKLAADAVHCNIIRKYATPESVLSHLNRVPRPK